MLSFFKLKEHITSITKTICAVAVMTSASPVSAQDKLASIAPVDRKMRAIDSISIIRLMESEEVSEFPASALYPEWNNVYTTHYGVAMPKEYKIDLREFCMPVDSRLVTSHYGYRRRFRRMHYGTDIKLFVGDTVRAAFSGKVRIVANQGARKGYGKYVVIRHANGLETVYGHLSKQLVKEDDTVKAGDPIALGGNTGRSTGPHLHFEARLLGQFIDPEKMFCFEKQDILADYYLFRSSGRGILLAAAEAEGGELEMSEEEANAIAKEEESREFQENKRAEMEKARAKIHKVKKGESLYIIAKRYGTTVDALCKKNGISKRTTLRPGQILKYS